MLPPADPGPQLADWLDRSLPILSRPLSLVDGRAYAATWLLSRRNHAVSLNRYADLVAYGSPLSLPRPDLFVVRADGVVFAGAIRSLPELDLVPNLPELPAVHLWSARGLQAFASGARPDPRAVFAQLAGVFDRFVDFDHSLAGQRAMVELIACFVISTWFLDAFNDAGALWLCGDRGTGKTRLLTLVSDLAYLGRRVHAGIDHAALCDLAGCGATLAFDDAERLADPRRVDLDRRALLFAGFRRGSAVSVKEWVRDHGWRSRSLDVFGARVFASTLLPGAGMPARAIVVPLVRTSDRARAGADPLDPLLWPHEPGRLRDDLWALALTHLPALVAYVRKVNERSRLAGRALEPWRSLLAVALWLDEQGETGLWQRMADLSVAYHADQSALQPGDLTHLVIRAIFECAASSATSTTSTISTKSTKSGTPPGPIQT